MILFSLPALLPKQAEKWTLGDVFPIANGDVPASYVSLPENT